MTVERRLRVIAGGRSFEGDLDDAVQRARGVLLDAFDRYGGGDGGPLVAVESDAVAGVDGLGELDVSEVFSVRGADRVAEAWHAGEVTPPVPPLTAEELAHYRWLVGGLLDGAWRLASASDAPAAVIESVDCAREIVDELMARLAPEDGR